MDREEVGAGVGEIVDALSCRVADAAAQSEWHVAVQWRDLAGFPPAARRASCHVLFADTAWHVGGFAATIDPPFLLPEGGLCSIVILVNC